MNKQFNINLIIINELFIIKIKYFIVIVIHNNLKCI